MGRRGPVAFKDRPSGWSHTGRPIGPRTPRTDNLDCAGRRPTTVFRYFQQLHCFLTWAFQNSPVLADDCDTVEGLDLLMSEYIRHLYKSGEPLYRGVYAVSALKVLDLLVYVSIPRSKGLLRNWEARQAEDVHHCTPWPRRLLLAVVLHLVRSTDLGLFMTGVVALAHFFSLARVWEIDRLCSRRVLLPESITVSGGGCTYLVIALGRTKTRLNDSVQLSRADPHERYAYLAVALVRAWTEHLPDMLWSPDYGATLMRGLRATGVFSGFVSRGVRAGGAVDCLRRGYTADGVLVKGRWAGFSVPVKSYLRELDCLLAEAHIDPGVLACQLMRLPDLEHRILARVRQVVRSPFPPPDFRCVRPQR